MSSWLRTWLPTLPSIDFSLPSGIQKRFLSFALRQALGHLLKPGQLDIQQVDSQIGAGFVQVRDVELDNEAINALIAGLPIQLYDGSVGKVTARIPWPNPLTAAIGLSLESLHLTFNIVPATSQDRPIRVNLAESVTSIAESFIHDELDPDDEAVLRDSFHPDLDTTDLSLDYVPGGLDPFIADEASHNELEPPGVSIFATLLERLLSRFQFDATDIRITLVHPGHASFTVTVPGIRYQTDMNGDISSPGSSSSGAAAYRETVERTTRTISISGVTVTTRCLQARSPQMAPSSMLSGSPMKQNQHPINSEKLAAPAEYSAPPSPTLSDSSELDEETHMLMSQSLVNLPPRPSSPASSVASSMYQSAVSVTSDSASPSLFRSPAVEPEQGDGRITPTVSSSQTVLAPSSSPSSAPSSSPIPASPPSLEVITNEIQDETILSFGIEPIVIRLSTPVPARRPVEVPGSSFKDPQTSESHKDNDKRNVAAERDSDVLKLDITLGVIAVALKARHIHSILVVSHLWASHTPIPRPTSADVNGDQRRSLFDRLEAKLRIRGVTVILLPATTLLVTDDAKDSLFEFFSRPLVPPRLVHGYVRMHLDSINATMSILPTSEPTISRKIKSHPLSTQITSSLSLSELSIFAFLASSSPETATVELTASPILITDPNLPLQYPATHTQPDLRQRDSDIRQTSFDVVDWTDPAQRHNGTKLSFWRTKVPQPNRPSNHGTPTKQPGSHSPFRSPSLKASPRQGVSYPTGVHREPSSRPHTAVSVKFTMTSRDSRSSRHKDKAPVNNVQLEVDIAPLHAFCDLALIFGNSQSSGRPEALVFLEELTATDASNDGPRDEAMDDGSDSEEDDEDTPPATPRASSPFTSRRNERDEERERKRLERLVLEDLDLGYDYRQNTPEPMARQTNSWQKQRKRSRRSNQTAVSIVAPVIRVELRASPHPPGARRSGAVLLDIHDLRLYPGGPPQLPRKRATRFAPHDDDLDAEQFPVLRQEVDAALLFGECERLVLAHSLAGESKSTIIFSLGSAVSDPDQEIQQHDWTGSSPRYAVHPHIHLRPQFTVSRSSLKSSLTASELTKLIMTVDIPAIYVRLSKPVLDGLQLWADDLSQMIEGCLGSSSEVDENGSKDPSLIGSRFFAKTRRSHDSGTDSASEVSAQRTTANTETNVKVVVAEVAIRLDIPRQPWDEAQTRPFNMVASDVDFLLEINPEGKDQTVLTLGVMDLDIMEHSKDGVSLKFLGLTRPHSEAPNLQSLLKLRFDSLILPETNAKESRIKVTLCGVTYTLHPDLDWMAEIVQFVKAPPGVFESVVPSERTRVSVKLVDISIRTLAASHPGSLILHIGELDFSTVLVGNLPEMSFHLFTHATSLFLSDNVSAINDDEDSEQVMHSAHSARGGLWRALGYALVMELDGLDLKFFKKGDIIPPDVRITVDNADLKLHLCADTGSVLGAFIGALTAMFSSPPEPNSPTREAGVRQPTEVASPPSRMSLLASLDEHAFRRQIPEVGSAPDLVNDDLPNNLDYLDDSFSAAGGLRALDDDEDEFDDHYSVALDQPGIIAKHGGETIRLLDLDGLHIVEDHFNTLPPDSADDGSQYDDTTFKVRVHNCDATVFLYDGYDWERTRKIIEEKQKEMRRKLAKIRQLVANGQTPDPSVEETNALLFNSVYIGLEHNVDELEPGALIAAIDEQLNEELETASQSSWQSLKPQQVSPAGPAANTTSRRHRVKLIRSRGPCVEFRLQSLDADIDNYRSDPSLASRTLVTVRDVEILDHIKTSTWSKFLTSLSTDSKGNIRETGSNMVRVELRKVHPVPGNPTEEARLRAKILPLRLYVDQDALDFLKRFFSFSDSDSVPTPSEPQDEIFFQQVEVFPVDIKLDYKPRRVDYRALRAGRTIELMNFFHFDGAEMTLRHITLTGITGWARVGDLLNDLWTPDVKATQLVEVISGVAPIRSVVNVGSGVADLVLLPIAQYKKDGRVIRGLQKGTTAFVQSTAIEAIKLGARLATGTQVILEQTEHVIGGQFKDSVTAEAVQTPVGNLGLEESQEEGNSDELISRYAEQPMNMKEGVKSAVKSLRRNFNSAAQTILAVPMEVYERSGNEGAVRAVVRAVPIAVLKPMIGASEAVSKTLMGIHNSLDPNIRTENQAKYKHR